MAERKPRSDRGRPATDWEAAFVFFAALPSQLRTYAAVAAEFNVSPAPLNGTAGSGGGPNGSARSTPPQPRQRMIASGGREPSRRSSCAS